MTSSTQTGYRAFPVKLYVNYGNLIEYSRKVDIKLAKKYTKIDCNKNRYGSFVIGRKKKISKIQVSWASPYAYVNWMLCQLIFLIN